MDENPEFSALDPVVNLTINHRQGASKEFSELLNRARTLRRGGMDEADVKVWKTRVRPKGHKDLKGAEINIVCTRKECSLSQESQEISEIIGG